MENKKYVNGFDSWLDTFFFLSELVFDNWEKNAERLDISSQVKEYQEFNGHAGLKTLTETWTTEFENKYPTVTWEEYDFYDTLEAFFNEKNKH